MKRQVDSERKDLLKIIKTVQRAHDETAKFFNAQGLLPLTNSLADEELQSFIDPEKVKTAYSQGGLLIEAAADHLMAFSRVLKEPAQTIAPWTCVRAVIETSALSAWLFDPGIDVNERVQRSLVYRCEGLTQEVKFLKASGDQAEVIRIKDRLEKVKQFASNLGDYGVINKNKQRKKVALEMPSVTEIINKTLHEEAVYRLLSAMSHGHSWAHLQLGFRQVENGEDPLFEKSLKPISIVFLCYKAILAFARPCWNKTLLFNFDPDGLRKVLEPIADDLKIQSGHRFWDMPIETN
jgi:hypothetical protein